VGFGIMAFGTGIALLPESAFAFASAKVPQGAATATMLLLLLLTPGLARAQAGQSVTPEQKSELQRQLEGDIMCMCGCRAPMNDCPMGPSCHGLQEQKPKLARFIDAGMDREQVRAAFVADYGSQAVLAEPIDRGFNRLAWLLPYVLGGSGALAVMIVAVRWSRRETSDEHGAPALKPDDRLQARLDDELRDLD
jgi:cytochrome c-type biogenesis protein CcmH/NrfF